MSEENLWSPLVYSRTFQADYRFIVMPEDIADSPPKKKVLKIIIDVISGLTAISSKEKNDRWLFIRDNTHCIIGIISKAEDLISSQQKVHFIRTFLAQQPYSSQKITKDIDGRDFYVFAGYVTQLPTNGELPFLPFVNMNRNSFEVLYSYVCKVWLDYQHNVSTSIQNYSYVIRSKEIFPNSSLSIDEYPSNMSSKVNLNIDRNVTRIWPDVDEYKKYLWVLFLKHIGDMSIGLGLDEKIAKESMILNATVIGNKEIKSVARKLEEIASPQIINLTPLRNEINVPKHSSNNVGTKAQATTQLSGNAYKESSASENFEMKDSTAGKEEQTITVQTLDNKNVNLNITINNNQPSILIPGILFSGIDQKEDLAISIYVEIKRNTKTEK